MARFVMQHFFGRLQGLFIGRKQFFSLFFQSAAAQIERFGQAAQRLPVPAFENFLVAFFAGRGVLNPNGGLRGHVSEQGRHFLSGEDASHPAYSFFVGCGDQDAAIFFIQRMDMIALNRIRADELLRYIANLTDAVCGIKDDGVFAERHGAFNLSMLGRYKENQGKKDGKCRHGLAVCGRRPGSVPRRKGQDGRERADKSDKNARCDGKRVGKEGSALAQNSGIAIFNYCKNRQKVKVGCLLWQYCPAPQAIPKSRSRGRVRVVGSTLNVAHDRQFVLLD